MYKEYWEIVQTVKEKSPLVHNITNYVVMNNTANALLAMGASPVMAHAINEVRDMVNIANALVINIGTLSDEWITSMKWAMEEARRKHKPMVFDPVGVGATPYRNRITADFITDTPPSVIRGNASEILAAVSSEHKTKGVDSTISTENAVDAARYLNENYGSVVCVSGKVDYIIDNGKEVKISNGHPLMGKITGMGCTASALIGAFVGSHQNHFEAVAAAMAYLGVAGELAAVQSSGPGSLQMNILDKLHNLSEEEFLDVVNIQY